MKHATPEALTQIPDLLARLRAVPGLVEKKPGVFYRKGKAFLHFHEDPTGLFADLRTADGRDFERVKVDGAETQTLLVEMATKRAG